MDINRKDWNELMDYIQNHHAIAKDRKLQILRLAWKGAHLE
jgi:hypothetical protein